MKNFKRYKIIKKTTKNENLFFFNYFTFILFFINAVNIINNINYVVPNNNCVKELITINAHQKKCK